MSAIQNQHGDKCKCSWVKVAIYLLIKGKKKYIHAALWFALKK